MLINLKKFCVSLCIACLFIPTLLGANVLALDRCENLRQPVRVAHYKYFGTDYPYHYSLGQTHQESNCRNVISKDGIGSEGPAQITYRWWKDALHKQGITEIRSTANHTKAQAYINYAMHKDNPHKKLWITYQMYNGGGLVLKEIKKAGKVDWVAAKAKCSRKVIKFSNGQTESACDINYHYSKAVAKYGELYRVSSDGATYSYW